MSNDDGLTPVQRSVLLILMAEARELPNADLTNIYKLKLDAKPRDGLKTRGLIRVAERKRRLYLRLMPQGMSWCRKQLGAEVPDKVGHGGSAAYALLEGIRRRLDHEKLDLEAFFARSEPDEPEEDAKDDIEALIREAYRAMAPRVGAWVKLADIRDRLGSASKPEVDEVLERMSMQSDVNIIPESNQKTLKPRDRDAAVEIGNQEKHLIAIGSS